MSSNGTSDTAPTLLTTNQAKELLAAIRPGLKIEVRWRVVTGPRTGARGTDRGVLFVEDGLYMLRRSANTYIPFFDATIAYEAIDVCREQSAPAARRLRDAEVEDAAARRAPRHEEGGAAAAGPRPERAAEPAAQLPPQQAEEASRNTAARPQTGTPQVVPQHPAMLSPHPAQDAQQYDALPGAPLPFYQMHLADPRTPTHARYNAYTPVPGAAPAPDMALSREIVYAMNDPRRNRHWGDPLWEMRTTPQSWATYFDPLTYRFMYGGEALSRWRADRTHAIERLRVELAALKSSHAPGHLTGGFLEQAHWAEWNVAHLLERMATPRTPEEARGWLHAGLGLLSAHFLLLGNTPKSSAVWATASKLWLNGKVDMEECMNFRSK